LAVELVETLSHSAIIALVTTYGVQSSSDTLKIVKHRLSVSAAGNDDDVALVSCELAIDLADPFSSKLFEIPVRGKNCTHLECFDLETWLDSRLGHECSFIDKWKCPICSADARPRSLRMDKWLSGVRKKLEEDGLLGTKSILVSTDGTWTVK
ncbi:hypothetical protein Micbo1qcDRAFT_99588, partial [Microdochium bolleyi]